MTPQSEMKPLQCPFCGSKPSYDEYHNVVTCCGAVNPMSFKRWQTRSSGGQGLVGYRPPVVDVGQITKILFKNIPANYDGTHNSAYLCCERIAQAICDEVNGLTNKKG